MMPLSHTLVLAALTTPAPVQEPPDEPVTEHVIGIAGDELVLLGATMASVGERARSMTEAQREEAIVLSMAAELERRVLTQAGRNLGFDPKIVSQIAKSNFDRFIDESGGELAASKYLSLYGQSPVEVKRSIEGNLLSQTWRQTQIGLAVGPTGRVAVDRYVRPGLMRMYYENFSESEVREAREALGATPETLTLEYVDVKVPAGTDPATVKTTLDALVGNVRGSESLPFSLIAEVGGAGSALQTDTLPTEEWVASNPTATLDLINFLEGGKAGSISDPILFAEVPVPTFRVYRIENRQPPGQAHPYGTRELHESLHGYLLKRLDDRREAVAFGKVLRQTYVWAWSRNSPIPDAQGSDQARLFLLEYRAQKRAK